MSDVENADLPAGLAEIVEDFAALGDPDRLQLLLDFSRGLPELPAQYAENPELMEPVPECQSPIFLVTEVAGQGADAGVQLHFSAPPEAPTTRGFASILAQGLDGQPAAAIAAVPDDFHHALGLDTVVSPLRLRGMSAMLARIKRRLGA